MNLREKLKNFFIRFNCFDNSKSKERNFDYQRIHGNYRVIYPDGKLSQPFLYQTACQYIQIFGGKIIPRETDFQ